MAENETILLADDNQDDALLLQIAFEAASIRHRVHVVANGREALDYLGGQGAYADRSVYPLPVMLLLDLKMPVLDGFAVLEWIRQHQAAVRNLTVVVLTGFEFEEAKVRANRIGVHAYLAKPFTFDQWRCLAFSLKREWLEPCQPPELEF